jgi:ankyrin repeat protein
MVDISMAEKAKKLTLDKLMRSAATKRIPLRVLAEPAVCHIMDQEKKQTIQNPKPILNPEAQRKLNDELPIALWLGDVQRVKKLLDKGANIEEKGSFGRTPLMRASYNGHTQVAKLLIQSGACFDAGDSGGYTPLMLASSNGHTKIAELLIQSGADVNARDNKGETPLFSAAMKGHTQTTEFLIQKGANLHARDNNGSTPLIWGASRGQIETVEILIQNGADVNARDNSGWTPLLAAINRGHIQTAELLIKNKADVNAKTHPVWTPLSLAVFTGHPQTPALLIKNGAKGALPKLKLFFRNKMKIAMAMSLAAAIAISGYFIKNRIDLIKGEKTVSAFYSGGKKLTIAQTKQYKKYFHDALNSKNDEIRAHAISLLGKIKDPDAIPKLIEMLDDEKKNVRRVAAWTLIHMAQDYPKDLELHKGIPTFIGLLEKKDFHLQLRAVQLLYYIAKSNPKNPSLLKAIPDLIKLFPLEESYHKIKDRTEYEATRKILSLAAETIKIVSQANLKNQQVQKTIPTFVRELGKFPNMITEHLAPIMVQFLNQNPDYLTKEIPSLLQSAKHQDEKVRKKALARLKNIEKVYYKCGESLYNSDRYKEALRFYRVALKINPANFFNTQAIAYCYLDLKQYKEAIRYYKKTLELDIDFIAEKNAHINMADSYRILGRYEKAIEHYEKGLKIVPNHAGVYPHLGDCYKEIGQKKLAAEAYRIAIDQYKRWNPTGLRKEIKDLERKIQSL